MKNKKIVDLVFIILSLIPVIFEIFFILPWFISPNAAFLSLSINPTYNFIIAMLFLSSGVFGIADISFSKKYFSKNEPMQYENERKYVRILQTLGVVNIILFIITLGVFATGLR